MYLCAGIAVIEHLQVAEIHQTVFLLLLKSANTETPTNKKCEQQELLKVLGSRLVE